MQFIGFIILQTLPSYNASLCQWNQCSFCCYRTRFCKSQLNNSFVLRQILQPWRNKPVPAVSKSNSSPHLHGLRRGHREQRAQGGIYQFRRNRVVCFLYITYRAGIISTLMSFPLPNCLWVFPPVLPTGAHRSTETGHSRPRFLLSLNTIF